MKNLHCFLEEESAKEVLQVILPKVLGEDVNITYKVYQGKQDLDKHVEKGLRDHNVPNTQYLVMRDSDSSLISELREELTEKVARSGKGDKTMIHIANHELENYFLGDLQAVEQGLGVKVGKLTRKNIGDNPDHIESAPQILGQITKGKYQKGSSPKEIAPYMKVDGTNRSKSFNELLSGVQEKLGKNKKEEAHTKPPKPPLPTYTNKKSKHKTNHKKL